MKQKLLLMITLLSVFVGGAKAQEPAITLTAPAVERTITIGLNAAGKVQIDWGNGEKVEQEAEAAYDFDYDANSVALTGTPVGDGIVKIYGEGIVFLEANGKFNEDKTDIPNAITAIDVTKATDLVNLYVNTNKISSIDLSKNTKLAKFTISNNPLSALDVTANTELTRLEATNTLFTSIDLSNNTKLTYITFNDSKLESLDLTANSSISSIYLQNNALTNFIIGDNACPSLFINISGNKLATLDVTKATGLGTQTNSRGKKVTGKLFAQNNNLTEIKHGEVGTMNISGNKFTLANILDVAKDVATLTSANQQPFAITEKILVGETIDLSSFATVAEKATTFAWINKEDTLKADVDYTVENGVFTFLTAQDSLYCAMTNDAVKYFTAKAPYTTTATQVVAPKELPLVVKFTAPAEERTIELGLKAAGKIKVDWGDGNLKEEEATGAYDGWDVPSTKFTGTPAGEVKVYAEGLIYFEAITKAVNNNGITAIDVTNATELEDLEVNSNNIVSIDLSKNTALKSLNIATNDLTSIDLSANTALTKVTMNDNKLTDFKLANGVQTIYLSNNPLGTLDLSPYTTIKSLYALNCGLTSVNLGENNVAKCYFSLNNNKLTTIDASKQTELKNGSLLLLNNNLTEVKLPAAVKALNVTGNKFTLASLYALTNSSTITSLTAASMQDMVIADAINESIDLSAQATLGTKASTIKWFLKDGTELAEGTDYTVENGVYTFIKEQADSVYATLLNTEALPKLTTAIKTTLAKVTPVVANGINTVATGRKTGVVYNLKGQRIAAPRKGLYIMDGKLMRK